MSVAVGPAPIVSTPQEVIAAVWPILESMAAEYYYVRVPRVSAAPSKPQDGQLAYADGVSWNPGSGRGAYRYDSTTPGWVFLG